MNPAEGRILLVEDDESARYVYAALLRHAGYQVTEAHDGASALALARSLHPDLIVLDLVLPDADGIEVLRDIRADPALHDIPVVVATVRVFDEDEVAAIGAGCNSFLRKPVDLHDFLAAVNLQFQAKVN